MNIDTLAGEGTQIKGRFKESLGDALGDPVLRREGVSDQAAGGLRRAFGELRDFARDYPVVAAAAALVVGFALLGTMRRA